MPTTHGHVRRVLIIVGVAVALGRMLTSAHAQPTESNPCLDIVRAHGLPVEGLTEVELPTTLRAACEAQQRLPAEGIDAGATDVGVSMRRGGAYRLVLSALAGAEQGCEGRCDLLRRVVFSLFLERLVTERFDSFHAIFEEDAAIAAWRQREPLVTFSREGAVESYARSIALARAARLRTLESALARRREGVVHPVFPGTTCARFPVDESPELAAATRRPRELLVYGSEYVGAPLDEAEFARVIETIRQVMARLTGLPAIAEGETDVLVREARLGRSVGRAACSEPLWTTGALEDARPDAMIFEVGLGCDEGECTIRVFSMAHEVVVPERFARLHAVVRGSPERVDAWVDATSALAPPPAPRRGIRTVNILERGVRRADVYGEGLTTDAVRAALARVLPELESCTPGTGFSFAAVLDVGPDGDVRMVRTNAEETGMTCRAATLSRVRLARGHGTRRALVEISHFTTQRTVAGLTRSTEPRGVQFGAFMLSDARLQRGQYRYMEAISAAIATCDTARATRTAPLAASIRLSVGGDGRITRARVTTGDAAVRGCLERELSQLATVCPSGRRPAEMRYALCSFAP